MIVLWRYRSATPGLMLVSAKIVDSATLAPASMGKLTLRAVVLLVMWLLFIPPDRRPLDRLRQTQAGLARQGRADRGRAQLARPYRGVALTREKT